MDYLVISHVYCWVLCSFSKPGIRSDTATLTPCSILISCDSYFLSTTKGSASQREGVIKGMSLVSNIESELPRAVSHRVFDRC